MNSLECPILECPVGIPDYSQVDALGFVVQIRQFLVGKEPGETLSLVLCGGAARGVFVFFFLTLVTGPRRSLSLKLGDTRVY